MDDESETHSKKAFIARRLVYDFCKIPLIGCFRLTLDYIS